VCKSSRNAVVISVYGPYADMVMSTIIVVDGRFSVAGGAMPVVVQVRRYNKELFSTGSPTDDVLLQVYC
jgi:hypothetical protein